MKKILITGANGMLAHDLIPLLTDTYELKLTDLAELDITDSQNCKDVFESFSPDILINCAAYTAVDLAESEGRALNYRVNALGVGVLAQTCKAFGTEMIHISTDYVFDGKNESGYLPDDQKNPLNQYGLAKRLGEELGRQHLPELIVIRTARLYGGGSDFPNFVNTMLRLGKEKDSLQVVNDQHGLPTYTVDLGHAIAEMVSDIDPHRSSTFHFTNSGEESISRYDFTCEIHKGASISCNVQSCDSTVYPRPAPRPSRSELKNSSSIQLPDWKDGLRRYLERVL